MLNDADLEELVTKAIKAKLSPSPRASVYDQDLCPFLNEAAEKIAVERKDVNTALREAEEKANQWLRQERRK
ncbi:hypothetical protein [Paenibacillus sp. GYB003]|uniref:hypothetical protein n=1 Tax=Paenibacillus sp. GYB003 TaxID=2994392 RepID=UPI002F96C2DB